MHLTLRQLEIFVAVGETGSTTGAAESISLSQSAVSAALNELESLLRTRLFDRVGKRLVLNDIGRLLLSQARSLLDAAHNIENQFAEPGKFTATSLKVGASTTIGNYIMPSLIGGFHLFSPAMHIDIHIGNTSEIASEVANFKVDVGFIEGPCHEPELDVIPWLTDELIIVSSPNHPLAQKQRTLKVSINDLRDANWLLRESGSGTREVVEQVLLPALHHLNECIVFGNAEAIKRAVAENLGISCLSKWVVGDLLTAGRLVVLRTPVPKLTRRFYVVCHKKKFQSAMLQQFIKHCRTSRPVHR